MLEQAVRAVMELEVSVLECADRIADVVPYSIRRVDQRVVPIGMKEGRERMRAVMVGEVHRRPRPERILVKKPLGAEESMRVRRAVGRARVRNVAIVALAAQSLAGAVIKVAQRREFEIVQREDAADR